MRVISSLTEAEMEQVSLSEENAIRNQIFLFLLRIINLRTPIVLHEGAYLAKFSYTLSFPPLIGETKMSFTESLFKFIARFLSVIDSDLDLSRKSDTKMINGNSY